MKKVSKILIVSILTLLIGGLMYAWKIFNKKDAPNDDDVGI